MILAIDPGPEHSAFVTYDGLRPASFGKVPNGALLSILRHSGARECVIEMIASYGMAVGAEVFETCVWIGRYANEWESSHDSYAQRLVRRIVKMHLCGANNAKDANIRQALIDRFGGKEKAIGNKKQPGPLYGIKADCWQALALAVTYSDLGSGTIQIGEARK